MVVKACGSALMLLISSEKNVSIAMTGAQCLAISAALMMAHGTDGLARPAPLLRLLVETPLWLQRVGPSRAI
jgi:hypothetical protein